MVYPWQQDHHATFTLLQKLQIDNRQKKYSFSFQQNPLKPPVSSCVSRFNLKTMNQHREHTLLLNRKRVNKGMKRTNSLPLSPVVPTRPYCRENRYLQVLRGTVSPNSYLGFSALCKIFFRFMYKIWQGRQLFAQNNPKYSLESLNFAAFTKQTNTKRTRKIFLQLGRICFRISSRQSENLSVFCKVFSQIAFRDMMVPFYRYQWRQPARAHAPLPLPHVLFDTTNLYIPLSRLAFFLTRTKSPDLRTKMKGRKVIPEAF